MCGRSSLNKTEKDLEERFGATFYSDDLVNYNPLPSFNIAPTHRHPVVTSDDALHLQYFQWGLIPYWSKSPSVGSKMINARIETILEKPAFKQAINQRRCLVPIDGFYEWKRKGKEKIPYRIGLKTEAIFCVAGIWEQWKNANNENVFTFSMLTQGPNKLMEEIHNRMPAILLPEQEQIWLDQSLPAKEVISIIQPYPDDFLKAYQVSPRVNKVSENDIDLLAEYKYKGPIQGSLF